MWSQNGEALPMAETARTSFGRRVPRKADWSPGQGTGQGPPWREQVPGARPWVQETQPGRREETIMCFVHGGSAGGAWLVQAAVSMTLPRGIFV